MLNLSSVSVAYGSKIAVRDLSLSVSRGEILALIGPNGAGKTSLIRAVSGVLPARSGEITCQGQDLLRLSVKDRARLLAVVPQARQFGGAYTVQQVVMMGRTPHMSWMGHPGARDHAVVSQVLMRKKDGKGRVAAQEIMIGTPAVRNLIREGKIAQLPSALQTGQKWGMQTLDQHLKDLVHKGVVTREAAELFASDPELFTRGL